MTISEKTLELNLCNELLLGFREKDPKAFWYGRPLRDEKDKGYDASLENANGRCLFFQFKRPLGQAAFDSLHQFLLSSTAGEANETN